MKPFEFHRAINSDDVFKHISTTSKYIAGGTNLLDLMKKHIHEPNTIIDLNSALSNTIEQKNDGIFLGAMTTNTKVTENTIVNKNFPLVSKAILAGASPQIRNMATTSGNLLQRTRCPYFYDTNIPCNKRKSNSGCGALNGHQRMAGIVGTSQNCVAVHPSDFCVALAALDAEVFITKTDSTTEKIPFKDFHRLPENNPEKDNNLSDNAIITGVFIPNNNFGNTVSYVKIRERDSYAFALVSVAAALEIKDDKIKKVRLASGGVAHKPWRWFEAEKFLKNKKASRDNFIKAAELIVSETKPLPNNTFKVTLLKGAVETALMQCLTNTSNG